MSFGPILQHVFDVLEADGVRVCEVDEETDGAVFYCVIINYFSLVFSLLKIVPYFFQLLVQGVNHFLVLVFRDIFDP